MKNKREQMVGVIKDGYGLTSSDVLSVMLQVPRHKFAPKENQDIAYQDAPVLIGYGQTMSQPYTVAVMTELLLGKRSKLKGERKSRKVLEIGTGSGYQAAILSKLFRQVYTVEIIPELAKKAEKTLYNLGYKNIRVKTGSGEWGWKEKSPFDAIMVTAGVEKVPEDLFDQLKPGGVLVVPVGKGNDKVMTRFRKTSARQTRSQKTSARQAKLQNLSASSMIGSKIKKQSNQVTKISNYQLKKEEFGTFHFVPFVEERN